MKERILKLLKNNYFLCETSDNIFNKAEKVRKSLEDSPNKNSYIPYMSAIICLAECYRKHLRDELEKTEELLDILEGGKR